MLCIVAAQTDHRRCQYGELRYALRIVNVYSDAVSADLKHHSLRAAGGVETGLEWKDGDTMHQRVLLTENYTVCMFEDARPDGARINAFPNKPVSMHKTYTHSFLEFKGRTGQTHQGRVRPGYRPGP